MSSPAPSIFSTPPPHYLPTDRAGDFGRRLISRLLAECKERIETMTTTIALAGKGGTGKTSASPRW